MNIFRSALIRVTLVTLVPAVCPAQTGTPISSTTPAQSSASARQTARKHKRRPATQVIRRDTIPPTAPSGPNETPQQRAADQQLLGQQQAQSANAAAVTNQIVQQHMQQQQKIQNEVRIQDAPGPAQTGVVPAAGPPVAPVNADDRIQDAPGPAQTLPPLPASAPAAQPASAPSQTPTQVPTQTAPPQS